MTRKIEVFKKPTSYHRYSKAISAVNALIRLVKGKQLMLDRENLNRLKYSIDFMESSNASDKRKEEIAGKSITASLDRNVEYLGVIQLSNAFDEAFKNRDKDTINIIKQFTSLRGSDIHRVYKDNLLYILKEVRDGLDMNRRLNK